jgi:hypothetical protein
MLTLRSARKLAELQIVLAHRIVIDGVGRKCWDAVAGFIASALGRLAPDYGQKYAKRGEAHGKLYRVTHRKLLQLFQIVACARFASNIGMRLALSASLAAPS